MPELSEQISDAYDSQGEKIEEYKKKTACHGSCIFQDNRKWPKFAQQRFRLDIENSFFFWKVVQILEQAAQRSGAMTISESGQGVAVALQVSGEHSGDGLMVELSDFGGLSLS